MLLTKPCDFCGLPSKSGCSVCKASFYCSSSHQTKMWRFHKLSCHESNFKTSTEFNRMPQFQDEEQPAMLRMHGMELVQPEDGTTIDSNFFVVSARTIFEKEQDEDRSSNMAETRCTFYEVLSASELYQLFKTTSLSPFYSAAQLDVGIRQLLSTYCTPFHLEHLLHECRMRNWIKEESIQEVPQYIVDSLEKLEQICEKLEDEGINVVSGRYRGMVALEKERIEGISLCRKGRIDVAGRNNNLRAVAIRAGFLLGDPMKAIALELECTAPNLIFKFA